MQNLLNSSLKKTIAIIIAVLATIALMGFLAYFLVSNVLPRNQNEISKPAITDPTTANETYQSALKAEQKNEYSKATELYKEALPYYKKQGEQSISDKNKAYGIEARIATLKTQQEVLEKNRAAEQANSVLEYSK